MIHLLPDVLSETAVITTMVLMLMMLIEFIHVRTQGKEMVLMDRKPHWQIVIAALLGLTPGCAGVFAVVSLYTHNIVGFGALLAACIASFGDEAFFMLSMMPEKAALVGGILLLTALAAGFCYQIFHPFQSTTHIHQIEHLVLHEHDHHSGHPEEREGHNPLHRIILIGGILLFITGLLTGFLGEHDTEGDGGLSGEKMIFIITAVCVLLMCCFCDHHFIEEHLWNHILKNHLLKIFLWSFGVIALLTLLTHHMQLESLPMRNSGKMLLLLLALGIGLVPQSGPHLAVIYLFADGIIPFSTLLANCLLQEGHGGIPLMAESPKTFVRLKAVKLLMAAAIGLIGIVTGW
ncbi:MAG: putative manganese transporter [Bacteroidales bacterium]|nr:putative manganese transporter [Bacteroidales bacterium]